MTVTVETVKDPVLEVSTVLALLNLTEGLKSVYLTMDGSSAAPEFVLPPGWNVGLGDKDGLDSTEAKVLIEGSQYTLTKEAALGVAHAVGLSPAYVSRTPGVLIANHLNYWAQHSPDLALKLLVNDTTALTVMKQSITPFSNVELLDRTLETIYEIYGEDCNVSFDAKTHHDLHITSLRVLLPDQKFDINGDYWLSGVQIRNSLVGKSPLSINGYLYRKDTQSGVVMHHGAQRYNRKIQGQDEFEVMQWLADGVKDVLGDAAHSTTVLASLTGQSIADSVASVLANTFRQYKVPLKVRSIVQDNLIESGDLTYHGLVNALAESANYPELPEHYVTAILEIAGAVAEDAHHVCNACKQVVV